MDFEIREHEDILDTINLIIRSGGIAEVKVERHVQPVVVEIKRQKRYPPKEM